MDGVAGDCGALDEAVAFLKYFSGLPDPRQCGKVTCPLDEVLLLLLLFLLAVLAGLETFVDVARFGTRKLTLLQRFRPFRDGTPSHDCDRDVGGDGGEDPGRAGPAHGRDRAFSVRGESGVYRARFFGHKVVVKRAS